MGTKSFGGQNLCLPKICWTQNIWVHLELKENLELECGPAQPNLFVLVMVTINWTERSQSCEKFPWLSSEIIVEIVAKFVKAKQLVQLLHNNHWVLLIIQLLL